jgi:formylmethanofuran dehydrogenase subunit E
MTKSVKPRNFESAQVGETTNYCQRCNAPVGSLSKSERDGLYVCEACLLSDFPTGNKAKPSSTKKGKSA